MKGHLGFRCRSCVRPSAPTNLRQNGIGFRTSTIIGATLEWDAPSAIGGGPILGYRVERSVPPTGWLEVATTNATTTSAGVGWCRDSNLFRVMAMNRCGYGQPAYFDNWNVSEDGKVVLLTSSSTFAPPCWASSVTAWTIGRGGTFSDGGGGGGMAWKTWSISDGDGNMECVIRNASDSNGPAVASVTFKGATIYGDAGYPTGMGAGVGGDGNASGNGGGNGFAAYSGQSYASITYPFTGTVQYSGNYKFGGGIGGSTPLPVSPCRRHPATDRNGLLAAVALLGMRVTEECVTEPAFGSGAVTFTMSTYGGSQRVDFTAGYGGGGFDSTNPGGPGCIVLKYT